MVMDEEGTRWEASTSSALPQSNQPSTHFISNSFKKQEKPLPQLPSIHRNGQKDEEVELKKPFLNKQSQNWMFALVFLFFLLGLSFVFLYLFIGPMMINLSIEADQGPSPTIEVRERRSMREILVTMAPQLRSQNRPQKPETSKDEKKVELGKFTKSRLFDQSVYFQGLGYSEHRNYASESFPQSGVVDVHDILSERHRILENQERELEEQKKRVENRLLGQLDTNSIQRMLRAMRRRKLRRKPVVHEVPQINLGEKDPEVSKAAEASISAHRSSMEREEMAPVEVHPAGMFKPQSTTYGTTYAPRLSEYEDVSAVTMPLTEINIPNIDLQENMLSEFKSLETRTTAEVPDLEMTTIPDQAQELLPMQPSIEDLSKKTDEEMTELNMDSQKSQDPLPEPQSELVQLEETTTTWPNLSENPSISQQMGEILPENLEKTLKSLETEPILPNEPELITVTPEDISRVNNFGPKIIGSAEIIPPGPPSDRELLERYKNDETDEEFRSTIQQIMPTLVPDLGFDMDYTTLEPENGGITSISPGLIRLEPDFEETKAMENEGMEVMRPVLANSQENFDYRRETVTMRPFSAPPTTQLPPSILPEISSKEIESPPIMTTIRSPLRYFRRKNPKIASYKKAMRKHRKPFINPVSSSVEAHLPKKSSRKEKLLKKLHAVEEMLNKELDRYIDRFNHNHELIHKSKESDLDKRRRFFYLAHGEPTRVLPRKIHKKKRHGRRLSKKKKRAHRHERYHRREGAFSSNKPQIQYTTTTINPISYPMLAEVSGVAEFFDDETTKTRSSSKSSEILETKRPQKVELVEEIEENRVETTTQGRDQSRENKPKSPEITIKRHNPVHKLKHTKRRKLMKLRKIDKEEREDQVKITTAKIPQKFEETTTKLAQTRRFSPQFRRSTQAPRRIRRLYYRPLAVRRIRLQPVSAYLSALQKEK